MWMEHTDLHLTWKRHIHVEPGSFLTQKLSSDVSEGATFKQLQQRKAGCGVGGG